MYRSFTVNFIYVMHDDINAKCMMHVLNVKTFIKSNIYKVTTIYSPIPFWHVLLKNLIL